jgi:His-Xaa-Ser repeat protein HxsA
MSDKLKFAIAALAVAGFSSTTSTAKPPNEEQTKSSFLDDIKKIVKSMTQSHEYTLAGHSSHASHGSHGSHRSGGTGHQSHSSHRSYFKPPDMEEDFILKSETAALESLDSRNENSTPRNTVLPSSPAIAVSTSPAIAKKLKILPGNSSKFKEVITAAQVALLARGYEVGPITGSLRAKTMAAVFKFQQESGLLPNGKLTPEVLTALNVVAK